MVLNYRIHGDSVNETETKLIFVATVWWNDFIWNDLANKQKYCSNIVRACNKFVRWCVKWIPRIHLIYHVTTLNITWRRNQELYMGDRAHFYLISIAAIGTLYRYSRQPLDTSVYIVQRKIDGDTTKIDLQILMWNHYTPPLPPRKNSRSRVHCI